MVATGDDLKASLARVFDVGRSLTVKLTTVENQFASPLDSLGENYVSS
jgi:hypothetical protein